MQPFIPLLIFAYPSAIYTKTASRIPTSPTPTATTLPTVALPIPPVSTISPDPTHTSQSLSMTPLMRPLPTQPQSLIRNQLIHKRVPRRPDRGRQNDNQRPDFHGDLFESAEALGDCVG